MEMTLHNKAMQPISQFAIQLNKNSFGVCPASPLHVPAPLAPNQSIDVSLTLATTGPVQRMDPLTNLQVCSHVQLQSLTWHTGNDYAVSYSTKIYMY